MSKTDSLDVYFGDERIGSILDTNPISFTYADSWKANIGEKFHLPGVPLRSDAIEGGAVRAVFENLLPEGELREYLSTQYKATSLFALLKAVGGDTVGGMVIVPGGQRPAPPSYEPTTWKDIAKVLDAKGSVAVNVRAQGARISLPGAQPKAGIAIFSDGHPLLPKGTSPSTHILKPNIKRLEMVWESAANETLIMRLAHHCNLPTAHVAYEPITNACLVTRFDRRRLDNESIVRLPQFDLCQLSGVGSEKKYEKEGGPGIIECVSLINKFSSQPAVDKKNFLLWLIFNLYTGNNDSHAKNLSLYLEPTSGIKLTPFYDLGCTRLYPGLSREFALSVGGETMPGSMKREHVERMAKAIGFKPRYVLDLADGLAERLPDAMERTIDEVKPTLGHSAKTLAEKLSDEVLGMTRKIHARITKPIARLAVAPSASAPAQPRERSTPKS
jgi:serine/threonine-protein kinase HipA